MADKLKFGVIGTNFISHTFAEAAEASGEAEVFAVCSRKRETGILFADKHKIPHSRVYTSFEEFSESGIDAVYVASPNKFHCEQSLFFLKRNIPVLCEKPAASDLDEYRLMRRTSEECGTVLMEGMRQAHDPAWRVIRGAIPEIGRIRHAAFEFCQYSSRYGKYLAGEKTNTFDPSLSNAAIMDIGVYPLHCLVMLFGEPLSASANSVFLDNGFEASGEVTLAYGGFTASALYSKVYDSPRPSAIFGEDGVILINKLSVPSEAILIRLGEEPEKLPVMPVVPNNMVWEIKDFAELVRIGKVGHDFADNTEAVMKILDKARAAAGIRF